MVKAAAGALIQPLHEAADEGAARVPQWARVYRAVRRAIDAGALAAGSRLPSARALARDWRVARGAVDEAFAQLQLEGLLERRVGDGTYVTSKASKVANTARREPNAAAQQLVRHMRAIDVPAGRQDAAGMAPRAPALHPRGMPLDSFPTATWRRLVLQAHDETRRALLGGGAASGLPALREAIVAHLASSRGVRCVAEQVLVISGPREGLTTITRLLLRQGEQVAIEDPTHPSLPLLFTALGQRVLGVPVDAQGFDTAALQQHSEVPRAVYLQPLSQYPLARRTSGARGDALLAWAVQHQAWIIEGQYNDEWVAPAQQPTTLFSRDTAGRVLLMNSFEGVMFPSLRVGYLVLPLALAETFRRGHARRGERVPLATQWALAQFMGRGHLNEHVRHVRELLHQRRAMLRVMLAQALPNGVQLGSLDSGAQFCLQLPACLPAARVVHALRQRRVVVEDLSRMAWQQPATNAIVLGYMGWDEAALTLALRTVGQVLTEALGSAVPPAPTKASA